ncbi:LysR family transcriptional regulator [Mesobacterium pallidum]|uniref:LysR family transcriptional regulator n=1 Tax=Mesobacterium pallidum TaxID=2872037 RepID=UPI001EE24983|nr:LysR family transcriptional regulator [Mesobacterium pallidum]
MRNLDITTLRSFVAVAQNGGVTRAAGYLNLTQSAVSMQVKRLEDLLGLDLLDRSARRVSLTPAGEQFLGYARRMVELNDEVFARLTEPSHEGEIVLGVPHDIVYPVIPKVLQRFNAEYPRVKVNLIASYTADLKVQFEQGECDIILTTEYGLDEGGVRLAEMPLRWIAAPDGQAWRSRPLRVAFGRRCRFRPIALRELEVAGIPWEMAVESESDRTIEATVSADLAVGAMLEGTEPPHLIRLGAQSGLPDLGLQLINLYVSHADAGGLAPKLADMIRQAYLASYDRPAEAAE